MILIYVNYDQICISVCSFIFSLLEFSNVRSVIRSILFVASLFPY